MGEWKKVGSTHRDREFFSFIRISCFAIIFIGFRVRSLDFRRLFLSVLSATVGQFGRYAIRHDIVITIIIISASGPLIESALRVNANMTALRLRDTIDGV